MEYQFDLVGKIGSMALIRREDADIDRVAAALLQKMELAGMRG